MVPDKTLYLNFIFRDKQNLCWFPDYFNNQKFGFR